MSANPNSKLIRTLGGALVEFDPGASVTRVRVPSDFSAVRIRIRLNKATEQLVRDMLEELGFGDCVEEVHMTDLGSGRGHEAIVVADSPSFATRVRELIVLGFLWRDVRMLAEPIAAFVPRSLKDAQVECRKVTVSWPKPGKEAYLSYGNLQMAEMVCYLYNGTSMVWGRTILGHRVAATLSPAAGPDEAPRPPRLAFKVTLTGLPGGATDEALRRSIRATEPSPRRIEIGGYMASAGETIRAVHRLLTTIGPFESFNTIDDPAGTQLKAVACFLNRSDALRAARALDKTAPPFYPKGQLSVRAMYTARFAIDRQVYDIVWMSLMAATSRQTLLDLNCHSADPALKVFKFEGESASDVAQVRGKVVSILSGIAVNRPTPQNVDEQVLKERFLDHVRHNADQFRFCPTPGCDDIYRVTGTGCPAWHTCSNCFKNTCSFCHGQHLGT